MSKYISKKAFVVILVLSVVVTYGVAYLDFAFNISKGPIGLPLSFSYFNFLGSSTDQKALLIDIAFWFFVIWVVWKVLQKITAKK